MSWYSNIPGSRSETHQVGQGHQEVRRRRRRPHSAYMDRYPRSEFMEKYVLHGVQLFSMLRNNLRFIAIMHQEETLWKRKGTILLQGRIQNFS